MTDKFCVKCKHVKVQGDLYVCALKPIKTCMVTGRTTYVTCSEDAVLLIVGFNPGNEDRTSHVLEPITHNGQVVPMAIEGWMFQKE